MNILRCGAFVLGLVLCASVALPAGADDKPARDKGKFGDRFGNLGQLLPKDAVEKLKLTDAQKEKLEAIQKEFATKQKEAFDQSREAIKKAFEDGDKDAGKKAFEDMRSSVEKVRSASFDKVASMLTDEQKKTLEEIKKNLPKAGEFRPGGGRSDTPPERRPGTGGTGGTGQLLPERLKDELKLTNEQKEKLAKLQKETDAKLMELLTDEQKKKLEELKKDEPTRRRPPQ